MQTTGTVKHWNGEELLCETEDVTYEEYADELAYNDNPLVTRITWEA